MSKNNTQSKSLYLLIALIFMSPSALAHGISGEIILFGLGLYILPFILGLWLVGKNNRLWFTAVSVVVYTASIFLGFIFEEFIGLNSALFSPYILLIIAWIKRKQTKT